MDYVKNAKLQGASNIRIMFVHILPNTVTVLLSAIMIGFNNAVLAEDIIIACGGKVQKDEKYNKVTYKRDVIINDEKTKKVEKNKLPLMRLFSGIALVILFIVTLLWGNNKFTDWQGLIFQFITILEATAVLFCFIPQKSIAISEIEIKSTNKRISIKRIATIILILIAVPLTIFFGMYCLDDRKYYFIQPRFSYAFFYL